MSTQHLSTFRYLHQFHTPLLLNNIWDAASAAIIQSHGANAVATSSAAIAWSLGYPDGCQLPVSEFLSAIKRILRVIKLPLTVDVENGYSNDNKQVVELVYQLVDAGVAGINIEDGIAPAELLADKISSIKSAVGSNLFINARTDIYLQNLVADELKLTSTIQRLNLYIKAGANCGFIPGLSNIKNTQAILAQVDMPINLMINGHQKEIEQFTKIGVKRLSLGPKPFIDAYSELTKIGTVTTQKNDLNYASLNCMF